jgi:hypothetical protein
MSRHCVEIKKARISSFKPMRAFEIIFWDDRALSVVFFVICLA